MLLVGLWSFLQVACGHEDRSWKVFPFESWLVIQPVISKICVACAHCYILCILYIVGDVILLGKTNMFRFNNPSEAAKLRIKRKVSFSIINYTLSTEHYNQEQTTLVLLLHTSLSNTELLTLLMNIHEFYCCIAIVCAILTLTAKKIVMHVVACLNKFVLFEVAYPEAHGVGQLYVQVALVKA